LAWGLFVLVLIEVFLVGLSRVVLDAHYPSDAIAAAFGGGGVLGIYGLLTRDEDAKAHGHGD
jgi:membrane-associated phospholipid phosphatase